MLKTQNRRKKRKNFFFYFYSAIQRAVKEFQKKQAQSTGWIDYSNPGLDGKETGIGLERKAISKNKFW